MWKNIKRFLLEEREKQNHFHFHQQQLCLKKEHVIIRQALIEDVDDLLEIEKASFEGQTPWQKFAFNREVRRTSDALYLIVETQKRPIAYVGCNFLNGDAHITNIAIIPEYQSLGLGSYLLRVISVIAREEECEQMSLEVRRSNRKAQQLYRKTGFVTTRIVPSYYQDNHEDAMDMIWRLMEE